MFLYIKIYTTAFLLIIVDKFLKCVKFSYTVKLKKNSQNLI